MDIAQRIQGRSPMIVVAREEGARLGVLSGVQIDPATRGLRAVLFQDGRKHCFAELSDIELFGEDVVLIGSRQAVRDIENGSGPPGRSLRSLRDLPVTSLGGERLGKVVDLRFDLHQRKLTALLLSGQRALDVEPDDVTIGPDELIVPAEYAGRVRAVRPEEVGVLAQLAGAPALRELATGMRRALSDAVRSRAAREQEQRPNA